MFGEHFLQETTWWGLNEVVEEPADVVGLSCHCSDARWQPGSKRGEKSRTLVIWVLICLAREHM